MAEENIYKQEFAIRSLPTRSVTLYPARAHVIRDIDEIVLKVDFYHYKNILMEYMLTATNSLGPMKSQSMGSLRPRTRAPSRSMAKDQPPSRT